MITKVELGSVDNKYSTPEKSKSNSKQSFTGLPVSFDFLLKGIQYCEQYPMVNVSVLDLSTAIVPRTYLETVIGSKKKDDNGEEQKKRKFNLFGGFEAFRRESSGLIINCLIPSFIVIGVAKLLNRPVMGSFNKSNLTRSWANSETIDKISHYYNATKSDNTKTRIYETLKTMTEDLHGVDGSKEKSFKEIFAGDNEFDNLLRKTANNIYGGIREEKPSGKFATKLKKFFRIKSLKNYTDDLYEYVVKKTGIAENIRFTSDKGYSTSNLKHLYDSSADMLNGLVKENIAQDADKIGKYFSKAKNLVNAKSAVGLLGVIIPLAISAQPINRWITHKLSGRSGAPIYNDDKDRHLTPEEKKKLTAEKFFAVPLMWGVAGLSMLLDRPSLKMFQFKSIFPTMDQARIISAATFSSRIATSEDSNELKENTIRDIATFSSFYFLGDYAAKGIATLFEKTTGVTLINRLKETKPDANIFQKAWNWAKHTTMKSTDELNSIANEALRNRSKNLRGWCQVGNLAFSLLSLGLFIPLYTRTQTNKKQKELEQRAAMAQSASAAFVNKFNNSLTFRSFLSENDEKAA